MPVALTCACGKFLRVKTSLAGRQVRCPVCGAIRGIPAADDTIEEEALDILLSGSPVRTEETFSLPARKPSLDSTPMPPTRIVPRGPRIVRHPGIQLDPSIKKRSPAEEDAFGNINGRTIGGILLSAVAVAWYASGYAAGFLVAGPIALLALGLVITAKGLFGSE